MSQFSNIDTSSSTRNTEVATRRGKKYNRINTETRKLIIGKSVANDSRCLSPVQTSSVNY
ncbi:hypothetical protein BCV72DRAFT_220687 [Rhizopus microsporus var. microsporus]|uniref:Uncharacterized protein n=1 Tax=Rhizopus microsporus var. microsporus TaxID=86635 RepID=A0A1X0RFW5_RHIZD|nr:hypothetical protein BCV72DRAFT_220687 [Rhizopus microsporus var. microsporus]